MFQIVKVQEKQIWPRTRASHHQDGGRFHEDRRRVCRVFRCGRREGPQPETGGGQQKEIRPQRWVINPPFPLFSSCVFWSHCKVSSMIFLESMWWPSDKKLAIVWTMYQWSHLTKMLRYRWLDVTLLEFRLFWFEKNWMEKEGIKKYPNT